MYPFVDTLPTIKRPFLTLKSAHSIHEGMALFSSSPQLAELMDLRKFTPQFT